MKVLFVFNTSGIPSNFAKGLTKHGIESKVISRTNPYGFDQVTYMESSLKFLFRIFKEARHYDIVHISGLAYRSIAWLHLDLLNLRKKLVVHLHGSDMRKYTTRFLEQRLVDRVHKIIVATPDLLSNLHSDKVVWVPTPVDTSLFKRLWNPLIKSDMNMMIANSCLYIPKWYESTDIVKRWLESKEYYYAVMQDRVPHTDLPSVLSRYEYYFDQYTFPALSKTAIEAYYCGCKVINNFRMVTCDNYPFELHLLDESVKRLVNVYESL